MDGYQNTHALRFGERGVVTSHLVQASEGTQVELRHLQFSQTAASGLHQSGRVHPKSATKRLVVCRTKVFPVPTRL